MTDAHAAASPDEYLCKFRRMLAENLKRQRHRQDLSQAHLAKRSGVAQPTISEIETEKGNPSLEVICRLAWAMDIPVSTLTATVAESIIGQEVQEAMKKVDAGHGAAVDGSGLGKVSALLLAGTVSSLLASALTMTSGLVSEFNNQLNNPKDEEKKR